MFDVERMASEPHLQPPSKAARLSANATPRAMTTALGLGLGLGVGAAAGGKSGFTFLQLQELEQQALIYKYLVAGVPVPLHLVLPIWKSIAAAGAATPNSSFLGCGSLCFDYRNSMEPEPGRCRRTDGKKWRCARDVVPDQKYCERHMHRGRNRSRKPVETGNACIATADVQATAAAAAVSPLQSSTSLSIS